MCVCVLLLRVCVLVEKKNCVCVLTAHRGDDGGRELKKSLRQFALGAEERKECVSRCRFTHIFTQVSFIVLCAYACMFLFTVCSWS